MKTFILFLVVFIGYNDIIGQNAIIKLKNGEELATSIQAISENSIFTKQGKIKYDEILVVAFDGQDPKYQSTYDKIGAKVQVSYDAKADFISQNTIIINAQQKRVLKGLQQYWKDVILPVDEETNKITYTEVISNDGDPDQLFKSAKKWAIQETNVDKSSLDFIDEENLEIIISKSFPFSNGNPLWGTYQILGDISYQVHLQFKEGRYRYEINNFKMISHEVGGTSPLESYLKTLAKSLPTQKKRVESQVVIQIEGYIYQGIGYDGIIDKIKNEIRIKQEEEW